MELNLCGHLLTPGCCLVDRGGGQAVISPVQQDIPTPVEHFTEGEGCGIDELTGLVRPIACEG